MWKIMTMQNEKLKMDLNFRIFLISPAYFLKLSSFIFISWWYLHGFAMTRILMLKDMYTLYWIIWTWFCIMNIVYKNIETKNSIRLNFADPNLRNFWWMFKNWNESTATSFINCRGKFDFTVLSKICLFTLMLPVK